MRSTECFLVSIVIITLCDSDIAAFRRTHARTVYVFRQKGHSTGADNSRSPGADMGSGSHGGKFETGGQFGHLEDQTCDILVLQRADLEFLS